MSYAVEMSDTAQSDIREIFSYIASDLQSSINAYIQIQRIEKEILSLSEMPDRYQRHGIEPWFSRNIRLVTVDSYCIFYHVDRKKETVLIIRVLYGGMDIEAALDKTE